MKRKITISKTIFCLVILFSAYSRATSQEKIDDALLNQKTSCT